jgi:hypothetical protein
MVVDASGAPLAGVEVVVRDADARTTTDARGAFAFAALPSGPQVVRLRRVGYEPTEFVIELRPGERTPVQVALSRRSQRLDTVEVSAPAGEGSARLADFERRRARGVGTFITRDEIERRAPVAVSDLLRRVGSVRIVDSLGSLLAVSGRGTKIDRRRPAAGASAPCVLAMMVDAVRMPAGTPLDVVPPDEIAAIEVYAGPASVPRELAQSSADAFCGLILIWTRG